MKSTDSRTEFIKPSFPRYSVPELKNLPKTLDIGKTYEVRLYTKLWYRWVFPAHGVYVREGDKYSFAPIWLTFVKPSLNTRMHLLVKVPTIVPEVYSKIEYIVDDVQSIHFEKHFRQFQLQQSGGKLIMKLGHLLRYSVELKPKQENF